MPLANEGVKPAKLLNSGTAYLFNMDGLARAILAENGHLRRFGQRGTLPHSGDRNGLFCAVVEEKLIDENCRSNQKYQRALVAFDKQVTPLSSIYERFGNRAHSDA